MEKLVSKWRQLWRQSWRQSWRQWWRKKWQETIQEHTQPTPKSLLVIMLFSAGLVWVSTHSLTSSADTVAPEMNAVDTFVPAGFVLVPIEVENSQALDSILGSHGVVDLYNSPGESGHSRKVASRIKILRAPMNPSNFAVLATSQQAPELVRGSRFFVVIKNPNETGTEVEPKTNSSHARGLHPSRLIVETVE